MKAKIFNLCLAAVLMVAFASCSTTIKVRTTIAKKPLPKLENIALVSVQIPPIVQPTLPLIDAAAFNKKTNAIADLIMDEQKKRIDAFRENAAETLTKYFKANILAGNTLHSNPDFTKLVSTTNFTEELKVKDDNFPFIMVSTGDINPFPLENGNVASFFKVPTNYKPVAEKVCTTLGTDAFGVLYTNLYVTGATAFGISGGLALSCNIYIFDKTGDMIASGSVMSKAALIKGKEIGDYILKLDEFSSLCDKLIYQTALDYLNPVK